MNTPFYSLFNANSAPTASNAMTISLNGLANASTRQSTLVANAYAGENQQNPTGANGGTSVNISVNGYLVRIYYSLTVGTNPNAGGSINFYLIQSDVGAPIITDGCGASDAAYPTTSGFTANTPVNAALLYSITINAVSGNVYKGSFLVPSPGPTWGLAVQNNTGVAMGSGNSINYVTEGTMSRF